MAELRDLGHVHAPHVGVGGILTEEQRHLLAGWWFGKQGRSGNDDDVHATARTLVSKARPICHAVTVSATRNDSQEEQAATSGEGSGSVTPAPTQALEQ